MHPLNNNSQPDGRYFQGVYYQRLSDIRQEIKISVQASTFPTLMGP